MGGSLLSMAFEPPCTIYVGASGAVFGFIGARACARYSVRTRTRAPPPTKPWKHGALSLALEPPQKNTKQACTWPTWR